MRDHNKSYVQTGKEVALSCPPFEVLEKSVFYLINSFEFYLNFLNINFDAVNLAFDVMWLFYYHFHTLFTNISQFLFIF